MLRSATELWGYRVLATDADMGRVQDFFFDDKNWILRYLVVDTGDWLPGRKILISPAAFRGADWKNKHFAVTISKEQVESSHPYDPSTPVNREMELHLYDYYGRPRYWA